MSRKLQSNKNKNKELFGNIDRMERGNIMNALVEQHANVREVRLTVNELRAELAEMRVDTAETLLRIEGSVGGGIENLASMNERIYHATQQIRQLYDNRPSSLNPVAYVIFFYRMLFAGMRLGYQAIWKMGNSMSNGILSLGPLLCWLVIGVYTIEAILMVGVTDIGLRIGTLGVAHHFGANIVIYRFVIRTLFTTSAFVCNQFQNAIIAFYGEYGAATMNEFTIATGLSGRVLRAIPGQARNYALGEVRPIIHEAAAHAAHVAAEEVSNIPSRLANVTSTAFETVGEKASFIVTGAGELLGRGATSGASLLGRGAVSGASGLASGASSMASGLASGASGLASGATGLASGASSMASGVASGASSLLGRGASLFSKNKIGGDLDPFASIQILTEKELTLFNDSPMGKQLVKFENKLNKMSKHTNTKINNEYIEVVYSFALLTLDNIPSFFKEEIKKAQKLHDPKSKDSFKQVMPVIINSLFVKNDKSKSKSKSVYKKHINSKTHKVKHKINIK